MSLTMCLERYGNGFGTSAKIFSKSLYTRGTDTVGMPIARTHPE